MWQREENLIRPGERTRTSPASEWLRKRLKREHFLVRCWLEEVEFFAKKSLLCSLTLACKDKGFCILFESEQKSLDSVTTSFFPSEKNLQEIKSVIATWDEGDVSGLSGCEGSDTMGLCSHSICLCGHLRLKTRLAILLLRYWFIHSVTVESFESFSPCRARLKLYKTECRTTVSFLLFWEVTNTSWRSVSPQPHVN